MNEIAGTAVLHINIQVLLLVAVSSVSSTDPLEVTVTEFATFVPFGIGVLDSMISSFVAKMTKTTIGISSP